MDNIWQVLTGCKDAHQVLVRLLKDLDCVHVITYAMYGSQLLHFQHGGSQHMLMPVPNRATAWSRLTHVCRVCTRNTPIN